MTVEETQTLAAELAAGLKAQINQATVLGLFGDLGAGKTAFVQGLARALGIGERVASPTFVIEKIYQIPVGSDFGRLIHIDAYRLKGSQELIQLGFNQLIKDPRNLIIIEWPEMVADLLPDTMQPIYFKFINEHIRQITYGR